MATAASAPTTRRTVVSLVPQGHVATVFRPNTWRRLAEEFELVDLGGASHAPFSAAATSGRDPFAVITGWGASPLARAELTALPRLELVVHTAGSVKRLFAADVPPELLLSRGIAVFSGADAIALNVAEATIGLMIMASRRWLQHDRAYRDLRTRATGVPLDGRFVSGATVGLVSASKVSRAVVRLLRPFEPRVLVFDPYLQEEDAARLGVERADLETLFRSSDIVSVHAPALPSTRGMITAELLRALPDGATFVNTSRGSVVDHDALLEECRSGRIQAALDVTEPEPLPVESPFWSLPNVVLLPHIAARGAYGLQRIGEMAYAALLGRAHGSDAPGLVPLDRWEMLA